MVFTMIGLLILASLAGLVWPHACHMAARSKLPQSARLNARPDGLWAPTTRWLP